MLEKAYSSMENTGNLFVLFKSLSQFIPKQQRKEIVKAVHNIWFPPDSRGKLPKKSQAYP